MIHMQMMISFTKAHFGKVLQGKKLKKKTSGQGDQERSKMILVRTSELVFTQ